MSSQEFGALLLVATAMSFTPGPNTTLSTALAANFGLRRALPFCAAVPAGWSLLMVLCGAGLGALIVAAPALRLAVKVVGVAYLLWLAFKLSGSRALGEAAAPVEVGFGQGVLLQFVNIKAWMLALTLTAGWVAVAGADTGATARRLGVVLAVMAVYAFASNLAYALAGALLRRWLAQGARLLWFNRGLAMLLVLTAAWMATV
ncbi:LysE family translocator [Ideonella sp. BN130291]|uniref:LysE family translocator n=1 Tax=Ideonella sp. BN130291 TaxID=3112940 RepID=UPI002E27477B|nr:LysE family translocator [Ideonella sp. BN130291]